MGGAAEVICFTPCAARALTVHKTCSYEHKSWMIHYVSHNDLQLAVPPKLRGTDCIIWGVGAPRRERGHAIFFISRWGSGNHPCTT